MPRRICDMKLGPNEGRKTGGLDNIQVTIENPTKEAKTFRVIEMLKRGRKPKAKDGTGIKA